MGMGWYGFLIFIFLRGGRSTARQISRWGFCRHATWFSFFAGGTIGVLAISSYLAKWEHMRACFGCGFVRLMTWILVGVAKQGADLVL